MTTPSGAETIEEPPTSRPAWQPRRHWEHRPGQARCGNDRQPDGHRRFVYLTVVPALVTCQPCRDHLEKETTA